MRVLRSLTKAGMGFALIQGALASKTGHKGMSAPTWGLPVPNQDLHVPRGLPVPTQRQGLPAPNQGLPAPRGLPAPTQRQGLPAPNQGLPASTWDASSSGSPSPKRTQLPEVDDTKVDEDAVPTSRRLFGHLGWAQKGAKKAWSMAQKRYWVIQNTEKNPLLVYYKDDGLKQKKNEQSIKDGVWLTQEKPGTNKLNMRIKGDGEDRTFKLEFYNDNMTEWIEALRRVDNAWTKVSITISPHIKPKEKKAKKAKNARRHVPNVGPTDIRANYGTQMPGLGGACGPDGPTQEEIDAYLEANANEMD